MGLKNKSLRKQDWFFAFCVYKNVSQKNCFLYINESYNYYHQQKTTCTSYIYTKGKTDIKTIIFKKYIDTLQKARQFASRFLYKKLKTLRYAICHELFWSWHLCTKIMTLCVKWSFYKTIQTLRKKQDNLRYVFICKNQDTLHYAIFIEFLKLAERRGNLYMQKQCNFVTFMEAKNNALCVTFLHTKILTLCVTFLISQKTMHFVLHFYI